MKFTCDCNDIQCSHYVHNIPVKKYRKKYEYKPKSKL